MENHRCKLCFRNFVNGKALGGHMRSHTTNFRSFSASSSEEETEEKTGSLSSLSSVHRNRGSETEKFPRSERAGKSRISTLNKIKMEGFFDSSVLDITHEIDAAHCLILLSRDHRRKRDETECQMEEKGVGFEDGDDYSEDSCGEKGMENKVRTKYYTCEICSKLFRSFQALGGHRASHNKIRLKTRDFGGGGPKPAAAKVACPFCPRVFTSGQAFGGHKRTHFIAANAKTIGPAKPFSRNAECFDIDLNLPASFDDQILL